ncbi:MAG: histidine kinase [Betaproteobacteria bacterium]|nr:histidine kinase [Betaproteobacteria bacterium]
MWTFGRKVAAGFAVCFVLLLGIGAEAYRSLHSLARTSYLVAHTHVVIEHINGVVSSLTEVENGLRGFIVTGDDIYLEPYQGADKAAASLLRELRELIGDNPAQQKRLDSLEPLITARLEAMKKTIDLRRNGGIAAAVEGARGGEGRKATDRIRQIAGQMEQEERDLLKRRADEVESASSGGTLAIVVGTVFCLLFISATGFYLTRSLNTQIGSAVQHIQSSSAELQSAATQQATGAKESSTSMTEITTTISELLATSRQIAESARRVTGVAEQTTEAARSGEGTLQAANTSFAGIRRQTDLIVNHMLELGKKSQQIGSVLDIVLELAEQTNILSINASIEAAGAGESGKRFGVVADEIRKLADRVSGSAKEIRGLIDDVRGAVNTTVMATETGSKAVDAGVKQFDDVASAFRRIAGLVTTTTDAAREIELSTKQQTTAVEQVNIAIANTAQATRETEASSGQVLQTASQLAVLSKDLLRLVKSQSAA